VPSQAVRPSDRLVDGPRDTDTVSLRITSRIRGDASSPGRQPEPAGGEPAGPMPVPDGPPSGRPDRSPSGTGIGPGSGSGHGPGRPEPAASSGVGTSAGPGYQPSAAGPVYQPAAAPAGATAPYRAGTGTGPSPRPTGPSGPPGSRKARLALTRVDPLSVTRITFAFSLCTFVILVVAAAVLWLVLDSIGVFGSIAEAADTLTDGSDTDVRSWLSFTRAMQFSLLIGAINVILITALATLGALLYNLCADMIGGIDVTLSDNQADR
jgi:hypothetical protein